MSNCLVNNHCQQECTKDQKSAIVIFGQWRWSSHKARLRKGQHSPPSTSAPAAAASPTLALSPASSLSSLSAADNREACCTAGESHGITLSQPADYRHSLAGPVLLRRARVLCGPSSLGQQAPSSPSSPSPAHPLSLFCIVFTCLTDTEPIIISFPQGPAPFVWQTLQTVSIPFSLSPALSPPL
ncbi:unnamed protein product [Pleuronectes platessa]|uniref:Uncharacterized protein n=1 Tax=Pleuronectes platessa TaxID=8262 RepID=A0A9N7TQN8_PLEPL|nr:unnamed protein product [Pleuronectes platessa]